MHIKILVFGQCILIWHSRSARRPRFNLGEEAESVEQMLIVQCFCACGRITDSIGWDVLHVWVQLARVETKRTTMIGQSHLQLYFRAQPTFPSLRLCNPHATSHIFFLSLCLFLRPRSAIDQARVSQGFANCPCPSIPGIKTSRSPTPFSDSSLFSTVISSPPPLTLAS